MNMQKIMQRRTMLLLTFVLLASVVLASCGSQNTATTTKKRPAAATHTLKPTPTPTQDPKPTPDPTPTYPPVVSPASTLGIVADTQHPFAGIPWVRLGYGTCFGNVMKGNLLKTTIAKFHSQGVRVMLSLCQWATDTRLYNTNILNDAAQGGADAVQCGNEQMKAGRYNSYVPPAIFARFFYLCQRAIHLVRPEVPAIIGAMDPQVGGADYGPLYGQVGYLNSMQYYMNTSVLNNGNWNWRSQAVGLIDSWHNGYPSPGVNSLYYLFLFWAQQFGVDVNSGALGKHLWVIEGTGCIFGCGIATDGYSVAVSHIMTLITDVQTSMHYKVPFFYFSARDFYSQGTYWPMGVRDGNDHPKPIRQDLWMGARTLTLSCSSGSVTVSSQEQLLAKMYNGCSLPGNYMGILES
ncbi:MAG TPA: hypothetical protein VEL49_04135 [Ktedonobacteraceae bacterium]|nr:hypothetical protein [Ktedonobacteraceae bacterium]